MLHAFAPESEEEVGELEDGKLHCPQGDARTAVPSLAQEFIWGKCSGALLEISLLWTAFRVVQHKPLIITPKLCSTSANPEPTP
jgi:hypothetical protein